jgi:hypothetical protein
MIEDLEGAASEPTRRGHVVALSLATACGAVMLFAALVLAPLEIDPLPRASLPLPGASIGPATRAVTTSTILSTIEQARGRACSYGSGTQWVVVSGAPMPAPTVWMTLTCSPSDVLPTTIDLRNTAR